MVSPYTRADDDGGPCAATVGEHDNVVSRYEDRSDSSVGDVFYSPRAGPRLQRLSKTQTAHETHSLRFRMPGEAYAKAERQRMPDEAVPADVPSPTANQFVKPVLLNGVTVTVSCPAARKANIDVCPRTCWLHTVVDAKRPSVSTVGEATADIVIDGVLVADHDVENGTRRRNSRARTRWVYVA